MQPKSTQRNLGFFYTKMIALALIFSACTQFSFAQQNPTKDNMLSLFEKQKADQRAKAVQPIHDLKAKSQPDNDANLPNRVVAQLNNPQTVCTTLSGTVSAADPSNPLRSFRDGAVKSCAAPGTCTAGFAGTFQYKILTWTNPYALAQCVTVTRSTTTANQSFVSVFSASPNLASLCTNWVSDEGVSPLPGTPNTFSFTIAGNATYYFLITNITNGQTADYSIVIDAPTCTNNPPPPQPCSWSASTVYPITVLDQANVTVGNTLYSFAGVGNGAVIATSYKFDGTTWTPIAPTPQGLEYPAAVTDGANIYILGGASTTGVSLNTLYRYNIASNTYTTLAPFTTGVWNPSAAYIGGKIYKFCGTGAAGSVNNLEIYDVASNTWTNGAPYPQALSFVSALAKGGFIYSAGGVSTSTLTASAKTYRYDPVANIWDDASIADMPISRWGAASDFYNNGFVMAGGYVNGAAVFNNSAVEWDQASNTWSALPNMTTACSRVGGATLGPAFYVIGGRTLASAGFNGSNQNQRLFCIPPTPCSGAPAPGNTISSSNPVCSGVVFTLSLQNNPFVSGLTYQWQSSLTGVPASFTNIAGATGVTYSTSQTGATYYRCNVTCTPSGITTTSTPVLVADGQGVFTSQPASTSIVCGGVATFSFTATGVSLVYGWEYRVNASSPWLTVTNGGVYSGSTTNTLTITNPTIALNGYQYRGLISGPCTAVDFSTIVTLTITPIVATVNPASATICTGSIIPLSITNVTSGATTVSFSSGPIALSPPDGSPVATISNLTISGIPAGSLITNVSVHLNMAHTYPADMVFNLKGPNNNILSLYKHNTNTDNGLVSIPTAGFYNAVVSSTSAIQFKTVPTPYRYGITPPTGPFAADALNGVTNPGYVIMDPTGYVSNATNFAGIIPAAGPNGTWTLAMCDGGAGDVGTLTLWSIDITYVAPVFATGVWTASPVAPNTMWNDPLATIPYVAGTPQTTIYVNPTVNTNYSVIITTATPCVSGPTVIPVSVTNPISALVNPVNKTVCVGSNATFSVSAGGGPLTYQWQVSVNSGVTWTDIPGATSATYTATAVTQLMNNNRYRVNVTAAPCGSVTTPSVTLTVNPLPVVTISSANLSLTPGQTTTLTASSVPAAATYAWTLNGSALVPPVTTSTITVGVDGMGDYQATVTDVNGCVNTSNILTVGALVSDKLWIFPNPTTGRFQVRLYYDRTVSDRRVLSLIDALGHVVLQREFDLVTTTPPYLEMDLDASRLPAGTYAVQVKHKVTHKIVSGLLVKFNN